MKKLLFALPILLLCLNLNLTSTEGDSKEESKITPFFNLLNESSLLTTGDPSDDTPAFIGFENSTSLEMGLSFAINDILSIPLFLGSDCLSWSVDETGDFSFDGGEVYAGLGVDIAPVDFLKISIALSNYEIFKLNKKISFGFDFETNLDFNFEKQFLSLDLGNNFKPNFNSDRAKIFNSSTYGMTFNFFNFINDKINTGLAIDGCFEVTATNDYSETLSTNYYNELFVGFVTNPVEFFTGYIYFVMYNEWEVNSKNKILKSSKSNSFGLKAGVSFNYEWFSTDIYYEPLIGIFIGDELSDCEHKVAISFGVEL